MALINIVVNVVESDGMGSYIDDALWGSERMDGWMDGFRGVAGALKNSFPWLDGMDGKVHR